MVPLSPLPCAPVLLHPRRTATLSVLRFEFVFVFAIKVSIKRKSAKQRGSRLSRAQLLLGKLHCSISAVEISKNSLAITPQPPLSAFNLEGVKPPIDNSYPGNFHVEEGWGIKREGEWIVRCDDNPW